jgi:hypothetical protein
VAGTSVRVAAQDFNGKGIADVVDHRNGTA